MTLIEIAQQAGIKPKWVAGTGGGEYHSACPSCGGKDRFFIQPYKQMAKCVGSYCCRKCGIAGDAIQFARQFLSCSFQEAAQMVNAIINENISLPSFAPINSAKPAILVPPPEKWCAHATDFVNRAHERLLSNEDGLQLLTNRGLPLDAVIRYKLGWSDKNEFFSRTHWGLADRFDQNNKNRQLWVPQGLVIPSIEPSGKVTRLKIRRCDWNAGDKLPKYVAISGSMNGLIIIGSTNRSTMIVVESELDAYAIHHAASDFAFGVAVGSNIKNPDNITDHNARNSKQLLICHDNDEPGKIMFSKWQRLYPHAINYPTPIGKDIGEAIQNGFNLREWLLLGLRSI